MGILKKAENKMAYAKIGLYGNAGAGKSRTATEIAIGLHKEIKSKKPVAVFDTEPAFSFLLPLFNEAGIEVLIVDNSRALSDLMQFMEEAEKQCDIIIIDSITHVWRDTQKSYIDKVNAEKKRKNMRPIFQLEFHHWRPIKDAWAKFTDRFLSSKAHVILCGRAGGVYEYQKNEDTGKQELITTGNRMATEKELGYEPSLLVEMVSELVENKTINIAYIKKDRADKINGAIIKKPNYKSFEQHFKVLNIGGEHFGSMDARNSQEMFDGDDGNSGFDKEKQNREIWCEEIKGLMVKHSLSGTGKEESSKRLEMLEKVFGTRSWTAIENMKATAICDGYNSLKENFESMKSEA